MAWKRSSVRSRPGPPSFQSLTDTPVSRLVSDGVTLPHDISDGEQVLTVDASRGLYISRAKYTIVLRDPLEETTLEFLWPIKIELTPQ